MPLILGDDRREHGDLGDLMPGRFGVAGGGVVGQGGLAVGADSGHERHDVRDARGGQSVAMMSGVPRLAAGLASGGGLDHGLGRPRRIEGGR